MYKGEDLRAVHVWEEVCTKRVPLNETITAAQVKKIVDDRIRSLVQARIAEAGSIKKAFSNLDEHPLWQNEERGIAIKTLTVYDDSKVIRIRDGYAITGGNHHALIYKDAQGNYKSKVVSMWEAVGIGLQNIEETGKPYPIIRRGERSRTRGLSILDAEE